MADGEVRRHLPEELRQRSTTDGRAAEVLSFLLPRASAFLARETHASGDVLEELKDEQRTKVFGLKSENPTEP